MNIHRKPKWLPSIVDTSATSSLGSISEHHSRLAQPIPTFPTPAAALPSSDYNRFIIRNLDTGDEIDLRNENEENFAENLAEMTGDYDFITFEQRRRENNLRLIQAVKAGDA